MEIIHETQEGSHEVKERVIPLYPERSSENIDILLEKIQALESGKIEKTPLSEAEREKILQFEKTLGDTLERIYDITPISTTFHLEYLLTEKGRQEFQDTFGIPVEGQDTLSIKKFLIENRPTIAAKKSNVRSGFTGKTRIYSDEKLFQSLSKTISVDGEIDIRSSESPESVSILLTPEKNLEKALTLRKFKAHLKKFRATLPGDTSLTEHEKTTLFGLLDLYQRSTNDMIVGQFSSAMIAREEGFIAGEEDLPTEELEFLKISPGVDNTEKNRSRFDKFIHGAGTGYDDTGWRTQVSDELSRIAEEIDGIYLAGALEKDSAIRSKNLDKETLFAKTIPWENFKKLGDETLASYGLLSDSPAEDYEASRPGTAPDGKWQFVCRDEYRSFSVDGKRKVLKTKRTSISIKDAIELIAHEIEGHTLQHENKSRVPLQLFKRVGGGRWSVFAECGAMQNQNFVSKEAFGFETTPHPHYIRAMRRRLEGGNYLECVQAFYESSLKELRLQKKLGRVDDAEFQREAKEKLQTAINRVRRLFNNSFLQSSSKFLTNSKDTVYLEQTELYRKLKEKGLEKYAYIGNANLKTIAFLLESGFLNPEDIRQPKFHSLKIWEEMKDFYQLST